MSKIRPLYDKLVIKKDTDPDRTAGGIVIPPDAADKKSLSGEVVAVGEGKVLDSGEVCAMRVKVGDRVIFGQYSGHPVKLVDEELLILSESEVYGVIEK